MYNSRKLQTPRLLKVSKYDLLLPQLGASWELPDAGQTPQPRGVSCLRTNCISSTPSCGLGHLRFSCPSAKSSVLKSVALNMLSYYAVKKVFVNLFAKFFEVFAKFFKVFASFLRFSRAFRGFWIHSDPLGCIRMHPDAFGSNWKRLGVFLFFFEIFESFFNVSRCNC